MLLSNALKSATQSKPQYVSECHKNGQGRLAAHFCTTASGTNMKPHLVSIRQTPPTVHEAHIHVRVQQCTWRDHLLVEGLNMCITQCPARTISNWCNTLILDSSQDHTTAEDYSRLKTSTTDQSAVYPSYNHWMNISITCLKLHLRSHTLNVLHLGTTKWLIQEKIKTK
jgi:hypothetical protein